MLQFARELFSKNQFKPTIVLLYATLAMVFWKYLTAPAALQSVVYKILGENITANFLLGTHKIFGAFFFFGLVPMLIVRLIFREKLADYGLQIGDGRSILKSVLFFLPIMFVIGMLTGRDPAFWDVYPYNPVTTNAPTLFLLHSLTYLFYYFAWEFFFRGFLQNGLRDSCGVYTAVLIQTMASTLLHFGHPMSETLGSIVGGLLWGLIALRCRSIWAGFFQHSVLGITLDWFILKNRAM
jgi:CAAX amino terminal protease family.